MKTVIISAGHSLSEPGAVYLPGGKESFLTAYFPGTYLTFASLAANTWFSINARYRF